MYQYTNSIIELNNDKQNLVYNNLSEKGANQLLTDTLLLEKENLLEGGFLLQNEERKSSAWSFGTKFSPVFSMGDNSNRKSSA